TGTTVTFTVTSGSGSLTPATTTTNAQGLASALLTLGSTAGVNSVAVSSGSLAGSPLTFTATATSAGTNNSSGQSVTWVRQSKPVGVPGFLGWLILPFDPVSNTTLLWSNDGGIYSGHMRFYDASANAFTAMPGSGSNQDMCIPDQPNMPSDRHPDGQMAIDTKRNML